MKLLVIIFFKFIFFLNFTNSVKISDKNSDEDILASRFDFKFLQYSDQLKLKNSKLYEVVSATGTIFIAGFGDKSFLITTIMATRHSKLNVLISAITSLILMGYISVQMGLILPELVPTYWIDIVAVLIFFILGVKMLIEGIKMKSESESEMYNQIQREINKEIIKENEISSDEEKNNLISKEKFTLKECLETFIQTFILIFLSELGDKSQISTIYLSSNSDPILIFYSVCFAQILLSIIAVIGGTFVSGKISEKNMTIIAGILFLAFGLISMYLTYINDYVIINSAVKNYLKNHNKNLNLTNHIPDRQTIMNSFLQIQAN